MLVAFDHVDGRRVHVNPAMVAAVCPPHATTEPHDGAIISFVDEGDDHYYHVKGTVEDVLAKLEGKE
jgi:hypothetical protein